MKGQWQGGKGSAPRSVDLSKYSANYDTIFRKKENSDGNESSKTSKEKNSKEPKA